MVALIVSYSFMLQMFFSQIKRPNSHQKKKKKPEKTEYPIVMKAKSDKHCSVLLTKYKLE